MTSPATIQDKAPKPAGLLPKNVQSWFLVSLAVLMVLIMWATGGRKPTTPSRAVPAAPAVQAPLEVNEAKIVEMQSRIQELQRQQNVAESALAQQTLTGPSAEPQPGASAGSNGGSPEQTADSIRAERKKRDYLSLFASNVALSYRQNPVPLPVHEADSNPPPPPAFVEPAGAPLVDSFKPQPPPALPAVLVPGGKDPAPESDRKEEPVKSAPARPPAMGKTYLLFEGTILETVLINRLDGQFSGPVECLSASDVYSHDRQHLLIPAGSKLLGETRKVASLGQTRLAVSFHRLVMPDGYSASLDQFKGLNQIGDTGLRDQVNNHYLRLFGASLAVGALSAVAQAGTSGALTASGGDLLRQGFAQSMGQSSALILDKFLNVLPTVTIREGHRVKVYLSDDLALPDYNSHKMPSDL
jgi:type IV secretion system protein TrbI